MVVPELVMTRVSVVGRVFFGSSLFCRLSVQVPDKSGWLDCCAYSVYAETKVKANATTRVVGFMLVPLSNGLRCITSSCSCGFRRRGACRWGGIQGRSWSA